jgi:hypothetical protein
VILVALTGGVGRDLIAGCRSAKCAWSMSAARVHTVRSASVGDSRAARTAGSSPAIVLVASPGFRVLGAAHNRVGIHKPASQAKHQSRFARLGVRSAFPRETAIALAVESMPTSGSSH